MKGNKPSFYQAFFKNVQELYTPGKVKDGLFAAMMDVALVNDGPVGIDYCCLENEVHPRPPSNQRLPKTRTDHTQVTIQIDTDPPKIGDSSSRGPGGIDPSNGSTTSTAADVNDLVNNMTRITKEFKIPAELIE